MLLGLRNRTAIAGGVAAFAGVAGLLVLLANRGGAADPSSLTVSVPPAIHDKIYGAPEARGRPIVVIDAGHGGRDPGAISMSGQVSEKQLTLALAQELRDNLVRRGRVRVAMTRIDDRYLSLEERADAARRVGAAMFVSVHMDSAPNPLARGATVYSLSDVASDGEAQRLAASQNFDRGSERKAGPVQALLSDLAMQSQMNASADLAARLVGKSDGRFDLRPNPHRFASFHVLRRAETPAVLFEAGYISNADDEVMLRSPEQRSRMALALAQAIETDVAVRARH
jgi:N-acetylmuramoyl-L-alanine amidase